MEMVSVFAVKETLGEEVSEIDGSDGNLARGTLRMQAEDRLVIDMRTQTWAFPLEAVERSWSDRSMCPGTKPRRCRLDALCCWLHRQNPAVESRR